MKYLFKYLMKGGSTKSRVIPFSKQEDEVEHYATKRMVGASDACWRLLDFPISKSEPTVVPTCTTSRESKEFVSVPVSWKPQRMFQVLSLYYISIGS
jgi:hypothetical protein